MARVVVAAGIIALAALAAPAVAETVNGIVAQGGCADLTFMMTPGGSVALAIDHPEQDERAQVTSWDLMNGRTHRFDIPGLTVIDADPRRLIRREAWLLPIDEESFAYWAPDARAGRSYVMVDIVDGHGVGQAAWLGDAPPQYVVSGPIGSDRRGYWVGRLHTEGACTGGAPVSCSIVSRRIVALNIATGETRALDWPTGEASGSDWRLDRNGDVALRTSASPIGAQQELQIRDGDGWRTLLRYESNEWLELLPPDAFGPETESILVISDVGRSGKAVGRLDLTTGAIHYVNDESSRGGFVGAELSADSSTLLWEVRRARSATGDGPITLDVTLVGAEVDGLDDSARGFAMTFDSPDAEALYEALRTGWGHVDVLAWANDGSAAIIELWGPDERRRIEAVKIANSREVEQRWELCDTARTP